MIDPAIRHLYIDDEHSIREMTLQELGRRGFNVTVAASGEEGLALFRKDPFPLVTSDLKMPGLSGLDVLRAVKSIDPDTEVLIATGYGSQEDAIECLKAGAYDYLYKPFHMDEFAALLERASERRNLKIHLALYECVRSMNQSLDLETVLQGITDWLKKTLRASETFLEMKETNGDSTQDGDSPTVQETYNQGENGMSVSLSAPLKGPNGNVGMLRVVRRGKSPSFSELDKRSLLLFATQAAQAVENARLHKVVRDRVEELERTREQLVHSEKMSAIGRLAAGVAHEINNPLTGILGQAQTLLLQIPEGTALRDDISFIETAAQRCRKVVQNLLQFSRSQKMEREETDLWTLVRQALAFMRRSFTLHNIEIIEDCEEDLPLVFVSPMHITQVLLNLFQNAFDAMGTQGVLKISARQDKDAVRLSVADTGPGISPEALPHIFEPFYTTKEIGKGTGLGLAVSQGIIREHNGTIEIHSPAEGQPAGAEFILTIPSACEKKKSLSAVVREETV
jgi:signal transduction histidine kinase